MIESAIFPYKIALSKANVKTNRMGSAKWTYQKKRSLAALTTSQGLIFRLAT